MKIIQLFIEVRFLSSFVQALLEADYYLIEAGVLKVSLILKVGLEPVWTDDYPRNNKYRAVFIYYF